MTTPNTPHKHCPMCGYGMTETPEGWFCGVCVGLDYITNLHPDVPSMVNYADRLSDWLTTMTEELDRYKGYCTQLKGGYQVLAIVEGFGAESNIEDFAEDRTTGEGLVVQSVPEAWQFPTPITVVILTPDKPEGDQPK